MGCPHCGSADTSERRERTELGYRRFRCRTCQREFNERTGTRFNHLQYPTDVVCLVVLWRVRDKMSLRGMPGMFLGRWMGICRKVGNNTLLYAISSIFLARTFRYRV